MPQFELQRTSEAHGAGCEGGRPQRGISETYLLFLVCYCPREQLCVIEYQDKLKIWDQS